MELFRGDSETDPSLGHHSYWSDSELHASMFAGFMRPVDEPLALYRADVTPTNLLDLRAVDPWAVLNAATGIDLSGGKAQRHDLIHSALNQFGVLGFDWLARYADYLTNDREHRQGGLEEWIYLGTGDVVAVSIKTLSNPWT